MTEASGVGAELAQARAALGLTVADVAQQLKFAPRQIEALEQERFESLPPGTFARGMLRTYARLLKLDPGPLLEQIAARVAAPDNVAAVASARRPIPFTDTSKRVNYVYAALSLAILGVIAAVVIEWQQERTRAARLSFVPAAQAPLEPQRAALASTVTPQIAPLAAAAEPGPEPRADAERPATAAGHRIVLHFERESWVEVRGRGGRVLTSALNPGGTERVVEGEPPFALVIGKAQHVRLTYDDQPVDLAPHIKVEVARFTLQ